MGKAAAPKNSPVAPPSSAIQPASAPPVGPYFTAATIARDLGVPLELVLELGNGNTTFTQKGKDELQRAIETRMSAAKIPFPSPAAGEPAAEVRETEDLMLTRVFPWSKNLLANRANGLEVVVQVPSSRFLQAGMVLQGCTRNEDGSWSYYGRLPRIVGEAQIYFPKRKSNHEK